MGVLMITLIVATNLDGGIGTARYLPNAISLAQPLL